MIAVAIFPVFNFLFLKLNLFPALHSQWLYSVLPFLKPTERNRALLDCVIDQKVRDILSRLFLACQNATRILQRFTIQDNPENFCREYVAI